MSDDIAARFNKDTANHCLMVLHDQGPYRHLRFKQPGTSCYWFDLITVPGTLIFQGDGTSYTFSRVTDMFEFFRGRPGQINPIYWSEKLTSRHGSEAMTYDERLFRARVKEEVAYAMVGGALPGLDAAVEYEVFGQGDIYSESGARRALEEFAFYVNASDRDAWPHKQPDFQFVDVWEMSFTDYDWWFLWACNAIVWGIAKYDATIAVAVAS